MSRGQQSKVVNAGLANSAADQAAAGSALTATNADLGDYTNRLNAFAAANPYKAGGEFAQDQSQIASSAADTSSNAIRDSLARSTAASGENTGGVANNVAEAQRQATRDQATTMANADATRIGNKSAYDGSVLQASSLPADLQSRLYGSAIGGSNSALGVAGGSANTPSFLDTLGQSLATSLGKVGGSVSPTGAVSGSVGCWIAEAIYGVDDIRTHLVREWLNVEFALRPIGKIVMGFYLRFGQKIAKVVRKSRILSAVLKPLFDCALSSAVAWKAGK